MLSWTAVATKSATADEPLHALGGYMKLFHGDFRLNCEDPPLFAYWAMIPHSAKTLQTPTDSPVWQHMLEYLWRQWQWCGLTLYGTPGNDPDAFIALSRVMMLLLGAALGAAIAGWAWRLAGPIAAVAAVICYSLDPNFLGHAPLVKNDVPLTLALLATMMAAWSVGRRATVSNVLLLAILCGTSINTKFSGLITLPIVGVSLLIRALLKEPWTVRGAALTHRMARLGATVMIGVVCMTATVLITWTTYGFRYSPTPDPSARFDMERIVDAAVVGLERRWRFTHDQPPNDAQLEGLRHTMFIRAVRWADDHRLLPQAWLAGLLDTYATTRSRSGFLHGRIHVTGRWDYFPLAMLYKTPTATLLAFLAASGAAIMLRRRRHENTDQPLSARWDLICIALPAVMYGYSIVTSDVNLGLRHALPLYPFIYILIGVVCARSARAWGRPTTWAGAVLGLGLAAETLAAHPNYIAFFNRPSGGWEGGIDLLGDSNLDWGQDLLLLQKWQRAHPDVKLYVSYFGMASPSYYLNYTPLPGDVGAQVDAQMPHEPGVAAVSATNLQGIYISNVDETTRARYIVLRHVQKPIAVLGGTIYLFEVTPQSPLFVARP